MLLGEHELIRKGKTMKITLSANEIFKDTLKDLKRIHALRLNNLISRYGQKGVDLLSAETPKYTGLASSSWRYLAIKNPWGFTLEWHNDDIENGYSVIALIRYGHGIKGGGYVRGREFIDPLMQPMFDQMIDDLWKEVCGVER